MMPKDNARIEFRPGLSEKRKELVDQWSAGKGGKAQAVYQRPFWREKGLSGIGISDISPIDLTFDNSPPGGAPGVLLAFFPTIGEAKPQSPTVRRNAIISALAKMFGDEARHPIDYVEMDWASERWTTGCVSPLAPGVLTSCGSAIVRPAGRIHFAGTETSPVWCGYMDGAVRSGQLAAQRLLGELSRRS
jgi:monoamine oxidase